MMPFWPDVGSVMLMSLMVPFSFIPTGSFNVTKKFRPMNSLAMVGYGRFAAGV